MFGASCSFFPPFHSLPLEILNKWEQFKLQKKIKVTLQKWKNGFLQSATVSLQSFTVLIILSQKLPVHVSNTKKKTPDIL